MTDTAPDQAARASAAPVTVEYRTSFALLTLNRPDKRNAMSTQAQAALRDALDEIKQQGTKVIVLTGAGDQSFCSGVDLKEPVDPAQRHYASELNSWAVTQRKLADHPAIVVGAVNGYALGGGLTLVHNCDIAVAAESATFGMPEITFGVYPALAGPTTARRLLPKHNAWLTLTGQRVDALTARDWGIVNEVVPRDRLLPRAFEIAEHIAKFDAIALDFSKRAYRAASELGWDAGIDYGLAVGALIRDQREVPR